MHHLNAAVLCSIGVFIILPSAYCDTYELYNTKSKTSDLKWTSANVGTASSGWEEVSGIDQGTRRAFRYYQICNRASGQDNWVRSPFIDARKATRLHVEMEFSITKCDSELKSSKYCRETFNLYYYESNSDEASSTFPPWREKPYVKIDTVAANTHDKVNSKTFTIGPLHRKGLYVAAQDQGACMSINSLKVYYYYCPETTIELAVFPMTIAGGEATSLVPLDGECVNHAQRGATGEAPTYYCGSDGKWQILTRACQCDPGYWRNVLGTICQPCSAGTFKENAGNERCAVCPLNSGPEGADDDEADLTGVEFCQCRSGFYRAAEESKTAGCTKPPSKPTALNFIVNSTGAKINWKTPLDLGGRIDTSYKISCFECTTDQFKNCRPCGPSANIVPPKLRLAGGEAAIGGLRPFTPYVLQVSARNGVSDASGSDPEYAEVKVFTAEAAPSMITNIYVAHRYETSVEIQWRMPPHPNGVILAYEVETRLVGETSPGAPHAPILKETDDTSARISELEPNKDYVVRIRSKNSVGFGPYSEMVQFSTMSESQPSEPPEANNMGIIITVAVVVIVVVVALIVFFYLRTKGHMRLFSTSKQKGTSAQNGSARKEREGLIGHRIYVEYPDPKQAMSTLNKELDPVKLNVVEKLIGEGEFAQVLHGKLDVDGTTYHVAVKQLKHGASVKDQHNFLREACSMAQFDHPNILTLRGVITKSRPVMIVSEYMENGSLDEFLTKHQSEFRVMQLFEMLQQIASGMRYLADMQYVHRDLAARNILVNSDRVCKVSDFGLSRALENDPHATYTTQGGKIAIRWAAPECIRYRQFTSASDVWSYGIVMWEVMSYGEKPYWDMTNQQVVQNIESGMRLPAPTHCPKFLHDKMLECWSLDPNNRPKFSRIVTELEAVKSRPALLGLSGENTNGNIPTSNSASALAAACAKTPNLQHALNHGEISTVEEWLKCQKLDKYKTSFLAHGLDTLDKVSNLTIKDLRSLGIDVTLHVHKLESGIRSLRRHLSTSSSRPTSSYSMEDLEQGEDDVIAEEVEPLTSRNGSFRVSATRNETTVLIPEPEGVAV